MKRFLNMSKFFALLLLVVVTFFGYRFFRVWQENERPEVSEISWEKSEVTLGQPVLLSAKVRVPWHREISSALPVRSPENLVASAHGGKLTRGALDLNGYRNWDVSFTMVPISSGEVDSQMTEIPLESTRRLSANTVSIKLPTLEVVVPEEQSDMVIASELLAPDAPPPPEEEVVEEAKRPFPTLLVVGIVVAALLLFFLIRWLRRPKQVDPPWVTAQRELDALDKNPPSEHSIYYLRLTDILKRYTSDRFETHADSASSTELLTELRRIPEFNGELKVPLTKVVRQADSVKFASGTADGDERKGALAKVREFVGTTIPKEEEEAASA